VYKSNVLISTENNNTLNDFYLNLTQKERLISLSILHININDSNENIHSLLFIKLKKKKSIYIGFCYYF
jgi:hypothetical protein